MFRRKRKTPPVSKQNRPFQIRRAPERRPVPPVPVPAAEQPPGPIDRERAEDTLLGRFGRPGGAAACWAGIRAADADSGARTTLEVRRTPDGALWLHADVPVEFGAAVVWACGGDAYRRDAGQTRPVPDGAELPPPPDPVAYQQLPTVPLVELLVAGPRRAQVAEATHPELVLLVSGRLANHVIRRGITAGTEVSYQPVRATRLFPAGPEGPAVLIRMNRIDGVPRALVRALNRLPQVIVGRSHGEDHRLVLGLGHRLPVDVADVLAEIPPDQHWVIGGPDGESWTVRGLRKVWYGANELLSAPELRTAPDLPETRATFVPLDIPVRLVPGAPHGGPPDAVLIAEEDLDHLRRYLTGRSLAETGFLVPGPAGFLVQEPGGLVRDLPLGQPLRRIGPGGLYVADGFRLYPAIPTSGRGALFSVSPGDAVVVCDGLVRRFHLDNAVPVWALWVGELPEVREEVSGQARELLERLDKVLDARPRAPVSEPAVPTRQHAELHRQAIVAQNDGDPIRAAGLLQQAGDFAAAARLLEQAALDKGRS